jgi:hypothetical protein
MVKMPSRSTRCFLTILPPKLVQFYPPALLQRELTYEQDFIPKLKSHLLSRLLHQEYDGDEDVYSDDDRNSVHILNNRIYSAKTLRVNFTTYDVRRGQDVLNPRVQSDIMVLSRDSTPGAHPYWYARILGIFHAQVLHTGPAATNRSVQHMEFLWVRWYGEVPGHQWGFRSARLFKVGFIPDTDGSAFGFLDPSFVLRGCHLIPGFNDGKTTELLRAQVTAARKPGEVEDWRTFYVMMSVHCCIYGHRTSSVPQVCRS